MKKPLLYIIFLVAFAALLITSTLAVLGVIPADRTQSILVMLASIFSILTLSIRIIQIRREEKNKR